MWLIFILNVGRKYTIHWSYRFCMYYIQAVDGKQIRIFWQAPRYPPYKNIKPSQMNCFTKHFFHQYSFRELIYVQIPSKKCTPSGFFVGLLQSTKKQPKNHHPTTKPPFPVPAASTSLGTTWPWRWGVSKSPDGANQSPPRERLKPRWTNAPRGAATQTLNMYILTQMLRVWIIYPH